LLLPLAFGVVSLQEFGIRFSNSGRKGFYFMFLWAEGLLGLKLKEMYVVGDNPKKVSVRLGDLGKAIVLCQGFCYALGISFGTTLVPREEISASPSVAPC
jgi:hypothetical protein